MKDWILYFIIFVFTGIFTGIYRWYALKKSLLDIPNERSSHFIPVPRGGGIVVAAAWFLGLLYCYYSCYIGTEVLYAFISAIPLIIIGFLDDMISLKLRYKFLAQVLSASLGLFFLKGLQIIDLGYISFHLSGHYFILINIFVFIFIIWFINLFNFIDGIDGYLGAEIVFLGISLFILTGNYLGILLVSSAGGFLIWNWPKAKIFMGDVGSTLCGFIIAVFVVYFQNNQQISIISWLILTSVFWFDATVTILRRFLNKEKLSQAHRKHAYQRIVQAGFTHQKTVLYSIGINVVGLGLTLLSVKWKNWSLIFLLMDLVFLSWIYWEIEKRKAFNES